MSALTRNSMCIPQMGKLYLDTVISRVSLIPILKSKPLTELWWRLRLFRMQAALDRLFVSHQHGMVWFCYFLHARKMIFINDAVFFFFSYHLFTKFDDPSINNRMGGCSKSFFGHEQPKWNWRLYISHHFTNSDCWCAILDHNYRVRIVDLPS